MVFTEIIHLYSLKFFYRHFALTKNAIPFKCEKLEDQAFTEIKELINQVLILKHPNFKYRFINETEAIGKGPGAILIQRHGGETSVI